MRVHLASLPPFLCVFFLGCLAPADSDFGVNQPPTAAQSSTGTDPGAAPFDAKAPEPDDTPPAGMTTLTIGTEQVIRLTDPFAEFRYPERDPSTEPGTSSDADVVTPPQPPDGDPDNPEPPPDNTNGDALDIPDDFDLDWQPVGLSPCEGFEPNESYSPESSLGGAWAGTLLGREDDLIIGVDVDGLDPNLAPSGPAVEVFAKRMEVAINPIGVPDRMWIPGPFDSTNIHATIYQVGDTFSISQSPDDRFWYARAVATVEMLDAAYDPTFAWQIARVDYKLIFLGTGRVFAMAEGIHCALYTVEDGVVQYRSRTMYPSVVLPVPGGGQILLDDMIRARATLLPD